MTTPKHSSSQRSGFSPRRSLGATIPGTYGKVSIATGKAHSASEKVHNAWGKFSNASEKVSAAKKTLSREEYLCAKRPISPAFAANPNGFNGNTPRKWERLPSSGPTVAVPQTLFAHGCFLTPGSFIVLLAINGRLHPSRCAWTL